MEIVKNLINIQAELKAPKNQKNTFGNYNYRSAEDILEAVKPLLYKNGCILTISDSIEFIGNRYYVKAIATLSNGTEKIESVAYAREEEEKKGMDGSQITGASSSYARKYALNGLFAIDDNKDSDFTNKCDKTENNAVKTEFKSDKVESKSKYRLLAELTNDWAIATPDDVIKVLASLPNYKGVDVKDIRINNMSESDFEIIKGRLNAKIEKEKMLKALEESPLEDKAYRDIF